MDFSQSGMDFSQSGTFVMKVPEFGIRTLNEFDNAFEHLTSSFRFFSQLEIAC